MALEGLAAIKSRISEIEQLAAHRPVAAAPATGGAAGAVAPDFASLLSGAVSRAGAGTSTGTATAQAFLDTALAEKGKPYVYGAHTSPTDADPPAFDCSELTKWAAARVGVTIPDGATAQFLYARDHGTTMSVEEALRTPGALLFHFSHEPRDLGDIPADGHVAISVGDGKHTIEARGRKYGTDVFELTDARKRFFNFAAMIPGM